MTNDRRLSCLFAAIIILDSGAGASLALASGGTVL
jgi:hypothetical protein